MPTYTPVYLEKIRCKSCGRPISFMEVHGSEYCFKCFTNMLHKQVKMISRK